MGRYFRLMALATTEIMLTTPLAIFSMWVNTAAFPVQKWQSWSETHWNYSRVEQIPAFFWRQNHLAVLGLEFTRWVPVLCALVFFSFFGFADEAKKNYRKAFWFVATRLGFKRREPSPKSSLPTVGFVLFPLHFVCPILTISPFNRHYQKQKPKSYVTTSSFAPSTALPPYSPQSPSSFYPMADVKKLQIEPIESEGVTDYAASHFDSASTASILQHEHEQTETPRRYSWRNILLPAASRRYSSYI